MCIVTRRVRLVTVNHTHMKGTLLFVSCMICSMGDLNGCLLLGKCNGPNGEPGTPLVGLRLCLVLFLST